MQIILTKVENDIKTFGRVIQEQEKKLTQNKKTVEQKTKEVENLLQRIQNPQKDFENFKKEYDLKRNERQEALFEEKDVSCINKDLNKIKEKIEIKEDEIISIQNKIDILSSEIDNLNKETEIINTDINEIKLKKEAYQVCINYNKAAKPFAKALKDYYDFIEKNRISAKNVFTLAHDGQNIPKASLDIYSIPKLYVKDHKAVFCTYDEIQDPQLETESTIQINKKYYPETYNWFKA